MKKLLTLLVALLAVASAEFAQATPVTYVFTGVADGSVGGTGFTAQTYRFSVTGDPSTVQNGSPPFSNVLNGGSISITGTACAGGCTITSPGNYLVFNDSSSALVHGISLTSGLDQPGSTLIEGCWNCASTPVNDNLVTNVSPTPSGDEGILAPYATFATSGGNVQLTSLGGHITYSVAAGGVIAIQSVPSLSPTGLILLAGLLGVATLIALRRRS